MRLRWRSAPVLAAIAWLGVSTVRAEDSTAISPRDADFFETKVRPLLVKECYACHSVDAKRIRGGLVLDSRPGWAKGGESGPVIVPGKPAESLLVTAVKYADEALKMPPKGKLDDAAIAILDEWVKRGAPDPRAIAPQAKKKERVIDIAEGKKWWAFQPLAALDPPAAATPEAAELAPIDRFLRARLEQAGLTPNPPADRRTLIRRATLDLIGLPPTVDEVRAFVNDPDPLDKAFAKVVDRLLANPHYGERWARHWLDLARFAESHGFEHDYDRPTAYHYRDFVIQALNQDMPFDRFAAWQIAGDELAPDDPLALKATGFLGAGVHNTQITANQVEKERYDELDDMANTVGTAFLGLTIGCARCHDHKYDPIPQRDYYRLLATFTSTVRTEIELHSNPEKYRKEKEQYEREHAPYVEALAKYEAEVLPAREETWEGALSPAPIEPEWRVLEPSKFESAGGATLKKLEDDSIKATGKNPDFDTYTITAACDLPEITAVRIEALLDPDLVKGGPGRASNGNFDLTDFKLTIGPRYGIGATTEAQLINPKATFEQAGLPIKAAIDDDKKSGWAVDPKFGFSHTAVFELGEELKPNGGATLTFRLDFQGNTGHNIGRVRVSATSFPRPVGIKDKGVPSEIAAILEVPRAKRTGEQTKALMSWYRTIDLGWLARNRSLIDHAESAPKSEGVKALICSEGLPAIRLHTQGADFFEKTYFLKRGDVNQKLEEASQGFLQVLESAPELEKRWQAPPPEKWRTSFRRRNLAAWLADVDAGAGALLARVAVNRLWQHHFGAGIVSTPNDFGAQGEKPTHPELLDWLARELVKGGWKLKPIHRAMLMSKAYQMSSHLNAKDSSIDPENRLLWRANRRRLEAEAIRDAMLAVSGMLDERMLGPGSLDERQPRRSIYFTVKRSRLIPMMTLFDAPDALTPIAVRSSTTIAPQALLLLNNPIVREYAAGLARRIAPVPETTPETAVHSAYELALGRDPAADELASALAFIASRTQAEPPQSRMAALTDFCQVVFGLNEFIYVD